MAPRKQQGSRISELFATSEDHVKRTHKTFDVARTTLTNAQTFGTEVHAQDASRAFVEAAEVYADALRTHAHLVMDYATERAS